MRKINLKITRQISFSGTPSVFDYNFSGLPLTNNLVGKLFNHKDEQKNEQTDGRHWVEKKLCPLKQTHTYMMQQWYRVLARKCLTLESMLT